MKILRLLDLVDKMLSNIHIEPNLCTKVISPLSQCSKCVDICPLDSIAINDTKIELDENCVNCGLCTAVCPTKALQLQKPSLNELVAEAKKKCETNGYIYIQCERNKIEENGVSTITVPCLGAVPKEIWMALATDCDNLTIYNPESACSKCELTTGEEVWKKEVSLGKAFAGKEIPIHTQVKHKKKIAAYDVERRELFSTLFSEVKSKNKLAIKELLGASQTLSRREKYQNTPETKMKKEWEHFSKILAEKITNESSFPYMNQRKLFLKELKTNKQLQDRKDVLLPVMTEDCSYCSACAILCPTDALQKIENDGYTAMTLTPYKCIECNLCVDICYYKAVTLTEQKNRELFQEVKVLIKKEKKDKKEETNEKETIS